MEPIPDKLPAHIAIIMDGNGRWARARNLPRTAGHRAGADVVRSIVEECARLGIGYLTLYAFSSENWARPKAEISALFGLLVEFLGKETPHLVEQNIRLNAIGDIGALPVPCRLALGHAMTRTASCGRMVLNLALNYGGRSEIIRAAKAMVREDMDPDRITEQMFADHLWTAGQPDPDLLIRTSGEKRLSNFLLWQCAYSELYFTRVLWPDFDAQGLHKALQAFAARKRRFGGAEKA